MNFTGTFLMKFITELNTGYLVTLSNHLTIPNITPMEIKHTAKNTVQHFHIGHALYITGPIQIKRLPTAVAPNQRPWHNPKRCLGATLDTNESPKGEINNSATVRKKYVTIRTHQPALSASLPVALNSVPDG